MKETVSSRQNRADSCELTKTVTAQKRLGQIKSDRISVWKRGRWKEAQSSPLTKSSLQLIAAGRGENQFSSVEGYWVW